MWYLLINWNSGYESAIYFYIYNLGWYQNVVVPQVTLVGFTNDLKERLRGSDNPSTIVAEKAVKSKEKGKKDDSKPCQLVNDEVEADKDDSATPKADGEKESAARSTVESPAVGNGNDDDRKEDSSIEKEEDTVTESHFPVTLHGTLFTSPISQASTSNNIVILDDFSVDVVTLLLDVIYCNNQKYSPSWSDSVRNSNYLSCCPIYLYSFLSL